ncbi:c-type cytochrome [Falsiroseomonas sp.]|uniref:c-type cytochrome n=1 Tax=Falsiroseomonas sp. TaxID=2870721 RepID=UPI003563A652
MRIALLLGVLLAPLGLALAQDAPSPRAYGMRPLWSVPAPQAPERADALAGRAVAIGGDLGAGWACVQCHGLYGAGDGSGAFPRLSGLSAWYLYKQLMDYASGTRVNAVMTPIARAMTEREMLDVATWYARQGEAPFPPPPRVDLAIRQRGAAIAAVGIAARGVTACVNCHGMEGEAPNIAIPSLAGQYAPYIALQLRLWKQGERRNGPLGVMAAVAAGMTEAEIDAVALYYASLRPGVAPR